MIINREQITKNILLARTIKGFTQEGLASILGHSQQGLQKISKSRDIIRQINLPDNFLDQYLLFD